MRGARAIGPIGAGRRRRPRVGAGWSRVAAGAAWAALCAASVAGQPAGGPDEGAPAREGGEGADGTEAAAAEALPHWGEGAQAFPHVRLNTEQRWVEFDGIVPIDVNDPDAPVVYLELVACVRHTKDHEVLVSTEAKASHIHAALLLLDLEPGRPGRWLPMREDGSVPAVPPEGPTLRVELRWTDDAGEVQTASPQEWIVNQRTGEAFPPGDWIFAGSMFLRKGGRVVYDADFSGTLVGLTTFGTETVAWSEPIHHEAGIAEPVWIAKNEATPAFKTPVTVRLTAVDDDAGAANEPTRSPDDGESDPDDGSAGADS